MKSYKRNAIKDYDLKSKDIDVRPLNQRESSLNIRKGMIRTQETPINISWMHKQLSIGESESRGDLTEPDYAIKGDIA